MKMRLGGIFHAARTLWALGADYSIAYFGPEYLDKAIQDYAAQHGASAVHKAGHVTGCPNVILVQQAKEEGPQGYELLLRDELNVEFTDGLVDFLVEQGTTDVLCFPNANEVEPLFSRIAKLQNVKVHLDANCPDLDTNSLTALGRPLDTFAVSTSSHIFREKWNGWSKFAENLVPKFCKSLLLKENRGGSRYLAFGEDSPIAVHAQIASIKHSVGVGDCFDAALIQLSETHDVRASLSYAASIAAEYAATTFPDNFRDAVRGVVAISSQEISTMQGISLPWELRDELSVYIAAPDFDYVDSRHIDHLAECLSYHNFSPRRPVQENGQMGEAASKERKAMLKDKDMHLLDECQILVAVNLFDDPGTLIEIGIACERGMPVIVYDPFGRASNLMLTELPTLISTSLDDVVTKVFECGAILQHEKS
jgi:hypothetical protein